MTDLVPQLNHIKGRFQSGNSVQIDKAMVPKVEFDYLIDRIESLELENASNQEIMREKHRAALGFLQRIAHLEDENAELRQKVQRLQARYEPEFTREQWDSAFAGLGTKGRTM
jgi:molecular chaperone GrpE (heat shock protein)